MTYNINVRLTAQAQTLAEAFAQAQTLATALALTGKFSTPGFNIDDVSIRERWSETEATAEGAAAVEVVAATATTETAAAAPVAETAPKLRAARAAKSAAAPAPAPASAAPAAPAPAPAAATHADLRAILVPIATVDAAGSKRVTKFIRDNGYMGTVDAIPAADLPALIVKAKAEFA